MTKLKTLSVALLLLSQPVIAADDSAWEDAWEEFDAPAEEEASALTFSTNIEAAAGSRFKDDPAISNDMVLAELRNRWNVFYDQENFNVTYKADLLVDDLRSDHHYETREANLFYRPARFVELKAGRQILTWGTGDLLFLNDLFPKDWQSFFSGRDDLYLKAPSDAIKVSAFSDLVNVDVVYTPKFDSDNYINGERISFYSPLSNDYFAAPPRLNVLDRDETGKDSELAVRLSRNLAGNEYALYFYDGFYKSPSGIDAATFNAYFPALRVLGASYRGSILGGIISMEVAEYQSKEDRDGNNPLIPNDQQRYLIGFEKELFTNFTFALQYYLELTKDYEDLLDNSFDTGIEQKEYRRLVTNRLTYRVLNGNLTYSLFSFYSQSDEDGYVRPAIDYRFSDQLQMSVGGNYFFGNDAHTFFNRFEYNSNLYTRVKYHF